MVLQLPAGDVEHAECHLDSVQGEGDRVCGEWVLRRGVRGRGGRGGECVVSEVRPQGDPFLLCNDAMMM